MPFFDTTMQKMGLTIHWEEKEQDTNKFMRACLGEFIALMFFVVLACGGAMTTLHSDTPNIMEISASFGFAIMVIAQFIGPLSGAHINCAVSFALWIGGRISGKRFVCYTLAQMAGAFAGGIILLIIFGTSYEGGTTFASNSWDPSVFNGGQVFVAEAFGTAILIFNVFATIDHPVEGGGALGVFPISMSVMVAHLFLVPVDGCSINPTRSFGTYLIASMAGATGEFHKQQYMFWFGPMFGAAVAAIVYEYAALRPKRRDAGGSLAERLHMSEVPRDAGGSLADRLHMSSTGSKAHKPPKGTTEAKWQRLHDEDDHASQTHGHAQAHSHASAAADVEEEDVTVEMVKL